VVGGVEEDGTPFLGMVGMIGTHYSDEHVTTGYASMLARPLFRERHARSMSEAEGTTLLHDGLRVCYYRDKQSMNKFQIAKACFGGGGGPCSCSAPSRTVQGCPAAGDMCPAVRCSSAVCG
jgi:20S proteasome subunit beta 7